MKTYKPFPKDLILFGTTNKMNYMNQSPTYLSKPILRPDDLAPLGVKSTISTETISFNQTFEHIWKSLK